MTDQQTGISPENIKKAQDILHGMDNELRKSPEDIKEISKQYMESYKQNIQKNSFI